MKKLWLFFLSIIAILSVWVSFADSIDPNEHYVDRCVKIENPHGISWYKLIIRTVHHDWGMISHSVSSVEENKCLPHSRRYLSFRSKNSRYLVDENIDMSALDNFLDKYGFNEIPSEEFESKLWTFFKLEGVSTDWWYVSDSNPTTTETLVYKIVKDWDNYKLEILKSMWRVELNNDILIKFWIAWILTILIETIVLFIITKLFRKKDQISNKRLILIWILASTITLPLLRFVLPLFIMDGTWYTVIWELLVTLIEVFIIKYWLKISRGKAILASIVCNLCSYLLWLIVF